MGGGTHFSTGAPLAPWLALRQYPLQQSIAASHVLVSGRHAANVGRPF
jgi:hypothetical protein